MPIFKYKPSFKYLKRHLILSNKAMTDKFEVILPKWTTSRFGEFINDEHVWYHVVTGIFPREGNEKLELLFPVLSDNSENILVPFNLKDIQVYYTDKWFFHYTDSMTVVFKYEDFLSYNGPVTPEEYAKFNSDFRAIPFQTSSPISP